MEELKKRYLAAKRRLFERVYGARLNSEQMRAVFTVKGPLLVLAGAGSGKTTVLVNRISYIIKYGNAYYSTEVTEGVSRGMVEALEEAANLSPEEIAEILPEFISEPCPPWQILAITFTNKAANEMKSRLSSSFEDKGVSDSIWAGTFHSICVKILRKYGSRLGYRDGFSIYDTDDKKRMVLTCMKELAIDENRLAIKHVCNEISAAKDSLRSPADYDTDTHDPRSKDIGRIYTLYQRRLMEYNAVDFDDIIMKTVELLKCDREVREYYQNKFKYVLVDEYQDTNYAQFVLTSILSAGYGNIMVVGDDDQSIYRFRGATIENILNFDKTYPGATVVKLEQNYRSTETILEAANAVIKNNEDRHSKKLWCDKGEGEKISLRECAEQIDEGRYIVDKINKAVLGGGRKYSDFAVLYRVNELARSLETAFAKSGVPHRIIGGMRFYDRKEIKDMLAYLSVINSPDDNLRLKRIINEPKRKIGTATVEELEGIAAMNGLSMYALMSRAAEYDSLSKSAVKLSGFVGLIEDIKATCHTVSELVAAVFERTGYRDMLVAEGFEGEGKINNVNELVSAALDYEKNCEAAGVEATLSGFLEDVALVSDVDKYDESADAVVLMTVHSAKGLEFPVVFLAGMEDGIFPSEKNMTDSAEMSEERRLAYVAITRAKEKLYITYSKNRTMYGRTTYNRLSCFVREEIPKSLLLVDSPRREPPRQSFMTQSPRRERAQEISYEMRRKSEILGKARPTGAAGYGVEKFAPGVRVSHGIFGKGVIVSAKDLGGDVLYEVKFDSGETKRLMATFAKLVKIQ
ncbi:MAG: UvrD-helicase domain-containing protein [Clostridia bacterium]|nr:UvrD-helicase domain-containing protein [Clostridia bacterium]